MRILLVICALLLVMSVIGCSGTGNMLSSDTDSSIQQAPTVVPVEDPGNQEGDPDTAGDTLG